MQDFISIFAERLVTSYGRLLLVGGGILFSLAGLAPFALVLYLIWLGVSAGHRRTQRARCFIDLLEIGLKQGRSLPQTMQSLSAQKVTDMGVHFHLLAAWLERGLRLSEALAEVPRFLPRHIRAMLTVGEELADIRRVLPVCRATLPSGASSTQKNVNSLIVLLFVSPVGPVLLWILWISVFPKFEMIMEDMAPGSAWSSVPFQWSLVLANLILAAWLLFFIGTCFQGAGEWILRTMLPPCAGWIDALSLRIPWRRRRVQRDFSALLALLLDAGVPEEKSVRLAAQGTGNRGFQKRAERVVADLREGVKLPDAVRWLDPRGEFRWRLQNACHTPNRFVTALSGWQDALEAKAFQQEQFFSQGLTTGFVLLNGVMVGLATITVFQALASITEIALW